MFEVSDDLLDDRPLAIDMLKECDSWAATALTAYIHKIDMFDMSRMNVDMVLEHQKKIRIVIKRLEEEVKGLRL